MKSNSFLRNVAAIVACLAVSVVITSCETNSPESEDDYLLAITGGGGKGGGGGGGDDNGGGGTSTVTGVTISGSNAVTVERGKTHQFTATVTGENNPKQEVTWTLAGAQKQTTTLSSSGLLTVAADETATSLTVTAKSVQNANFNATATVTLSGGGNSTGDDDVELAPNGTPLEGAILYDEVVYTDESSIRSLVLRTWKGGFCLGVWRYDFCIEGIRQVQIWPEDKKSVWVYVSSVGWLSFAWNEEDAKKDDYSNINNDSSMKKIGTKTVLDKTCELWEVSFSSEGKEYKTKIAVWHGISLWVESTVDGVLLTTITAIKLKIGDIPDKAFTKTLTIDWIDGFVCSGN